jgi:hypothetical protein
MELTPEQIESKKKQDEAIAARNKVKADNKARRDGYRALIGKAFTNGEIDVTITGFQKSHITDKVDAQGLPVHAESFTYHMGNPNHQKFMACEQFIAAFIQKGAV